MIKYLGSKRRLIPVLGALASAAEVRTAVDLFTGTTRVAQEFKRRGIDVLANDIATYSEVLAQCHVATDGARVDVDEVRGAVDELNRLPGVRGYVTRMFCEESRYFQPKNGRRIDAVRDAIEQRYGASWMRPILLTSLLLAADRVDSTTGVQMAYLKQWAPRSHRDLELRLPELLPGRGSARRSDALELASSLPRQQLVYLDPPYNQHRYYTNYHIWETLIRWDAPEAYGVARKRSDARDDATKSPYNKRREMPAEMRRLLQALDTEIAVVSYNDESWIEPATMLHDLRGAGFEDVRLLAFDHKRYVGAQIGIHGPSGEKVGTIGRLRNVEYLFVAGASDVVDACAAAVEQRTPGAAADPPTSQHLDSLEVPEPKPR